MATPSKFIVVEHKAQRAGLHYDIRFRMPNSKNWASFASRKPLPLEPSKKTMVIRTHDHTEEEALYLGKIESGYGSGVLKKWDDGKCSIEKYSSAHIAVRFNGRKIKGLYHFISTGVIDRKYDSPTYLFFRGKE